MMKRAKLGLPSGLVSKHAAMVARFVVEVALQEEGAPVSRNSLPPSHRDYPIGMSRVQSRMLLEGTARTSARLFICLAPQDT